MLLRLIITPFTERIAYNDSKLIISLTLNFSPLENRNIEINKTGTVPVQVYLRQNC